jgi:hypothetical protein
VNTSQKYPESYFEHWLAMFIVNNKSWTTDSYNQQIELYKFIEGNTEFSCLQNELREIILNNDLILFLDVTRRHNLTDTEVTDLELMAQTIINSN